MKYECGNHNHPAGWVIERGGVALLMFVDPVSFGVLHWISCLFVKFACQFHWFYCFSVRWPSNMDISSPRRVLDFWWVISQSDSGAMVLAHENGFFFLRQGLVTVPVRDIRNIVGS